MNVIVVDFFCTLRFTIGRGDCHLGRNKLEPHRTYYGCSLCSNDCRGHECHPRDADKIFSIFKWGWKSRFFMPLFHNICLQFLSNIMPKQTCVMLLSGPLIDYAVSHGGVVYRDFEWTHSAIFAIRYYFDPRHRISWLPLCRSITCLMAAGVNVFTCFLIGKTSAVRKNQYFRGIFTSMVGSLPGSGASKIYFDPHWWFLVLRSWCKCQENSRKLHSTWYAICMSSLSQLTTGIVGCVSYGFFKNKDLNNSTATVDKLRSSRIWPTLSDLLEIRSPTDVNLREISQYVSLLHIEVR